MSPSQFSPLGPAHYIPTQRESKPEPIVFGDSQNRIGVFFATREGQTKQIAEHIAVNLRAKGFDVDVVDVGRPIPFSPKNYAAAVLAASVHSGNHEPEMIRFVKEHRADLERMMTAFLSVTLSEAGAERKTAKPAEHARFVQDVNVMLSKFFNETKWAPALVKPVAGALLYSRYNFLVRFVMKSIAKKAGAATDTSRDYVYTDWASLDKFIEGFAEEIRANAGRAFSLSGDRAKAIITPTG